MSILYAERELRPFVLQGEVNQLFTCSTNTLMQSFFAICVNSIYCPTGLSEQEGHGRVLILSNYEGTLWLTA